MSGMSAMRCGRRLVVRCGRELSDETGRLIERMAQVHAGPSRSVVLDLSNAAYADSGGLRWLLRFMVTLEQHNAKLHLVVAQKSRVARTLALSGYGCFLSLHSSARSAWRGALPA
jgi:anti-anti-sigma factor